jgi:pimeloyl-ACP methyl ester carboxylesterase
MPEFVSDGLTLAYDDIGPREGRPVVLVHGFTSNRSEAWRRLGWYGAFERKRIRCIALDCRGHGQSACDVHTRKDGWRHHRPARSSGL